MIGGWIMNIRTTEQGEKTRKKIYKYLIDYVKEYGYAPSVREIAEGVGLKSTASVHNQLSKLEEEGKIKMRGDYSPRAIKILGYEFVKKNDKEHDKEIETDNNI